MAMAKLLYDSEGGFRSATDFALRPLPTVVARLRLAPPCLPPRIARAKLALDHGEGSCVSPGTRPERAERLAEADPWVEIGIEDVDQQVGQDEDAREHDHDGLDDLEVAGSHGIDDEEPGAGPGEHAFR